MARRGTFRGRLGFAWDRALLYGTAGLAWGDIHHSFHFHDNFNFDARDTNNQLHAGYVVGGGIEYAFSRNLSLKAEYQYIDLGSQHIAPTLFFQPAGPPGIATVFSEHTDTRNDFHTVRLGLNWKFDPLREAPLK